MDVTQTFQNKNASHPKNASFLMNDPTSALIKRFSVLNAKACHASKNDKTLNEHFSSNNNVSCPPKNAKTEHYESNLLNDARHRNRRTTRCNLPKGATNVLKDWLVRNYLDPYPPEKEKEMLAHTTGLRLGQVNNWLINARRRLLPAICLKYGLDHSKCKIAKRGGNRNLVLENNTKYSSQITQRCLFPGLDRFSVSFPGSVEGENQASSSSNVVLNAPGSPEHPTMLDYLADVMLVNEELEKQPNEEGLSRRELLCRRGLGERFYPCSP